MSWFQNFRIRSDPAPKFLDPQPFLLRNITTKDPAKSCFGIELKVFTAPAHIYIVEVLNKDPKIFRLLEKLGSGYIPATAIIPQNPSPVPASEPEYAHHSSVDEILVVWSRVKLQIKRQVVCRLWAGSFRKGFQHRCKLRSFSKQFHQRKDGDYGTISNGDYEDLSQSQIVRNMARSIFPQCEISSLFANTRLLK